MYLFKKLILPIVISIFFFLISFSSQKVLANPIPTEPGVDTVQKPSFDPLGGHFDTAQTVHIQTITNGAHIRYTKNGSTPTENHGTLVGTEAYVNVPENVTIKAIGYKDGMYPSVMRVATYYIGSSSNQHTTVSTNVCNADGSVNVTLTWQVETNSPNYVGQYKKGSGAWSSTITVPVAGVWTISNLKANKQYHVRIKKAGENSWTTTGNFTTSDCAPATTPQPSSTPGAGGGCRQVPDVNLSNRDISGNAGETKHLTATVTNNNGANCPDATFALSANKPNPGRKWVVTFDPVTVSIPSGHHQDVDVAIKPNNSVNAGPHTATVKATSHRKTGTQTLTYHVAGGGNPSTSPTDNPTGNPTGGPSPSPTPGGGGGGHTVLRVSLGIDGMGSTVNFPTGGNENPIDGYDTRAITFKIYNTDNTLALSTDQSVTYDSSDKRFHAQFNLPQDFATGTYNIYAVGLPYLTSQYPGSKTITRHDTTRLNSNNFNLITGNINDQDQSANTIDILDYNVLISCWVYSTDTQACDEDSSFISNSDLNGDGAVDENDYTLLLEEIANQHGITLPDQ